MVLRLLHCFQLSLEIHSAKMHEFRWVFQLKVFQQQKLHMDIHGYLLFLQSVVMEVELCSPWVVLGNPFYFLVIFFFYMFFVHHGNITKSCCLNLLLLGDTSWCCQEAWGCLCSIEVSKRSPIDFFLMCVEWLGWDVSRWNNSKLLPYLVSTYFPRFGWCLSMCWCNFLWIFTWNLLRENYFLEDTWIIYCQLVSLMTPGKFHITQNDSLEFGKRKSFFKI